MIDDLHPKRLHLPFEKQASHILGSLSPFERILFWLFVAILIGSSLFLLHRLNEAFLVEVPRTGGSIVEGIVGSPRFINPVLSITDADRDLTALVYAGLLRPGPDGRLAEELAERYEISEDGLTYTFTLRENASFHDGTPITAADVLFTVERAQDPALKSPRRASWDGVIAEQVDERTVRFTLPRPYAPFLENATLGILPRHLWENVSAEQFPFSQFNIEPVGAGPYKIGNIKRSDTGLPVRYELSAFEDYVLREPFIQNVTIRFYAGEQELVSAYREGEVRAIAGISPEAATELAGRGARVERAPLPRVFGVFFNQNQKQIFTNRAVRRGLELAAEPARIVDNVLLGFGTPLDHPLPPGILANPESARGEDALEAANTILEENGWEVNAETGTREIETDDGVQTLTFTLSTSNTPELKRAAEMLVEAWARVGASVTPQFFEISDLNQNVIRPRRYDALLFGEIVGRDLDLFSFWHSSQRNDPGLNIALYTNITVDSILENLRATAEPEERTELYEQFAAEVSDDVPAVFLYAPDFIYILPSTIQNARIGTVTTSGDRFATVHEWYINTERVWSFFVEE